MGAGELKWVEMILMPMRLNTLDWSDSADKHDELYYSNLNIPEVPPKTQTQTISAENIFWRITANYIISYLTENNHMNHNVKKRSFEHVRPAKIQISLRITAVWSESPMGVFWIAKGAKFLQGDKEDPD